ncbi:MAG TPA: carbohydrate kinase [Actinobacteria bacterium]|nr:carbohydrate kinase [Actinomycetota bacterium]
MRIRPVVCVGALHMDAKARLAGDLIPGTSNPAVVTRTPGGVACNVARSLARLDVPVSLISVIGDDDVGHRLLARAALEGLGVGDVVVRPGSATAGYTAVLDRSGSLTFGIADMAIYDDFGAEVIERAVPHHRGAIWFVDANPAAGAIEALAPIDEELALDPVSIAKSRRLLPLLAGAAVVFPDAGEAEALTGAADPATAAKALLAAGVDRAVVTVGARGVVVADAAGVHPRPAIAPRAMRDVTGAGDAFIAGYLAAWCRGEADPVGWGLAAASLTLETLDTVRDDLSVEMVRERLG